MHRINTKHKKTVVLRVVTYGTILLLSTITTIVLLYVALGYRLGSSGHVVRTGLLLVRNEPEAAGIYINGKLKDASAPGRFVLSAGEYDLSLKRSGYREWKKRVSVAASGVREVTYPLLIPETLRSASQLQIAPPSMVTQSNNRKFLLTHEDGQASLGLIELKDGDITRKNIALPENIMPANAQAGSLKAVEWALDNKHLLLDQTLSSGATMLVSLDVTKPEDARDVTSLYAGKSLDDPHYAGEDTDAVYGLRDGVLYHYNFEKNEEKALLTGVRSYQPYGNETILYDRQSGDRTEIGILQDGKATRIHTSDPHVPAQLAYAKYNDYYYLSVAEPGLNTVTIYRDPLKNPLKEKQSPFFSFEFAATAHISVSASGQFLLVQNGSALASYDFEDFKLYPINLSFAVADGTKPTWLSATLVHAQAADGANYLFEYDGQNMQQLPSSRAGNPIAFSPDLTYFYRIAETNAALHLESGSMLTAEQ